MANQSAGVYEHGKPVTASPAHGGLVPVHGGLNPMHGTPGYESLGRRLASQGVASLLNNPQAFDLWFALNQGVSANAGAAPDGSNTADKITPDTTPAVFHSILANQALGAGTFAFSVFAKAAGYPRLGMRVFDGAAYRMYSTFDIAVGGIVDNQFGGIPFMEDVGNGWWFCGVTGTSPAGNMGTTSGWAIESLPAGLTAGAQFAGNGSDGALLWQGQALAGDRYGPIIFE